MDEQTKETLLHLIGQWDRRAWAQLPADFELQAVRRAFQEAKKHFPKHAIKERIAASKAATFTELRDAIA